MIHYHYFQGHIFLVCAEHDCEAIFSSCASVHSFLFAPILCKQKRIHQNRYIRLINNTKNTASAISLRWHYPNQVTGPDHIVCSQPAIGKLPLFLFSYHILQINFCIIPIQQLSDVFNNSSLLTDDIIALRLFNCNIYENFFEFFEFLFVITTSSCIVGI